MLIRWLWMRVVCNRRTTCVIWGLEFWVMWHRPDVQEEERTEDWILLYVWWFINHTYVMRLWQKLWMLKRRCTFLVGSTLHIATPWCFWKANTSWAQISCRFWTFSDHILSISPFGWFWFISFYYNKTNHKYSALLTSVSHSSTLLKLSG